MSRSNQPVSIRSHGHDRTLAHGWVAYASGWLLTTCGLYVSSEEYVLLAAESPVTCMTCLVKDRK